MNSKPLITLIFTAALIAACHSDSVTSPQLPSVSTPDVTRPDKTPNTPVERPEVVVATLNRLYNDTQNNCREVTTNEPRGHYYCSGVLVRGVRDGDFPPWSHSPINIAKGSSSYSWIRHDIPPKATHIEPLLRAQGFILRNPMYGAQNRLFAIDVGFICLFPFDGEVDAYPFHKGCAVRKPGIQAIYPQPEAKHHNAVHAWGSCEDSNIRTLAQWYAYYDTHFVEFPPQRAQCSWNVDNPLGWDNAIAAFNVLHERGEYSWNELLLTVVDDGSVLKKYIAAFYYTHDVNLYPGDPEALEAARSFQRKLNANGYTVPILLLDFDAPPAQRFSYHPEDQAIAQ
jgi:hypothetical protein